MGFLKIVVNVTVGVGLVLLHGGRIGGFSAGEGSGSTFFIEIPLYPAQDGGIAPFAHRVLKPIGGALDEPIESIQQPEDEDLDSSLSGISPLARTLSAKSTFKKRRQRGSMGPSFLETASFLAVAVRPGSDTRMSVIAGGSNTGDEFAAKIASAAASAMAAAGYDQIPSGGDDLNDDAGDGDPALPPSTSLALLDNVDSRAAVKASHSLAPAPEPDLIDFAAAMTTKFPDSNTKTVTSMRPNENTATSEVGVAGSNTTVSGDLLQQSADVHSVVSPKVSSRPNPGDVENSIWESGLHFFLVDDALSNRKVVRRLLTVHKHTVTEADDGDKFIEVMEGFFTANLTHGNPEYLVPFDVILMDDCMPRLSGPEACKAIRNRGFKGVIIGLTGHTMEEDIEHFLSMGATHVLTKPLNVNQLKCCVRQSVLK